jgi:magnesium-transporting ATPase (P-type)
MEASSPPASAKDGEDIKNYSWDPVGNPIEKSLVNFYCDQVEMIRKEELNIVMEDDEEARKEQEARKDKTIKDQMHDLAISAPLLHRLPFAQELRRKVSVRKIDDENVRVIVQGSPQAVCGLFSEWENKSDQIEQEAG